MQQKEFGANMCYLYLTWCASLYNTVYTMGKKSCSGLSTVLRAPSRVQLFVSKYFCSKGVLFLMKQISYYFFLFKGRQFKRKTTLLWGAKTISGIFTTRSFVLVFQERERTLEIKLIQICHYVTDNVWNPFTSKLNDGFFTGSIFVNNKS